MFLSITREVGLSFRVGGGKVIWFYHQTLTMVRNILIIRSRHAGRVFDCDDGDYSAFTAAGKQGSVFVAIVLRGERPKSVNALMLECAGRVQRSEPLAVPRGAGQVQPALAGFCVAWVARSVKGHQNLTEVCLANALPPVF